MKGHREEGGECLCTSASTLPERYTKVRENVCVILLNILTGTKAVTMNSADDLDLT